MAESAIAEFYCFSQDLAQGKHNLAGDAIRVMLTNDEPDQADTHVNTEGGVCILEGESEAVEVAAGDGYAKGGPAVVVSSSEQTAGAYKLVIATLLIPALGSPLGPFRYAVFYNSSKGMPATRPAIGWADYGESTTLDIGQSFAIGFDQDDGLFTLQRK
jgi:hypothetical protein